MSLLDRCLLLLFYFIIPLNSIAGEVITTENDQQELLVTIYNSDLATVRDERTIWFTEGSNTVVFRDISLLLKPETSLLQAEGVKVLEHNFDHNLLSQATLLKKNLGKQVILVTENSFQKNDKRVSATVLSAENGGVFKTEKHIMTGFNGIILYPGLPEGLYGLPSLTMKVNSEIEGERRTALTYLTNGLSWQSDYTAVLDEEKQVLKLKGFVTILNNSEVRYHNAQLRLIAGNVNQVQSAHSAIKMQAVYASADGGFGLAPEVARTDMFEYHQYSFDTPVSLSSNQQKQILLAQADQVAYQKQYLFNGNSGYYQRNMRGEIQKLKAAVYLDLENQKDTGLGKPLPGGIMRVYQKDSQGILQFVGENTVDHTPINETISLKIGDSFNVTGEKKQIDYKKIVGEKSGNYAYESEHELTLKNAKDESVTVRVDEPIPGDWKVLSSSEEYTKESANLLRWAVVVPAKGIKKLRFRVRVQY